MFVRNHMTRDPVCVGPSAPVRDVLRVMTLHRVDHVPVLDQRRRAIGIVSTSDICRAIAARESLLDQLRAEEVMSGPRIIDIDAPLRRALDQLCEDGLDAFVVQEGGGFAGLLTRADVLRAVRSALAFDQEGSCVEVSLDDPDDLVAAFQVLHRYKAEIRSAVVGAVREDGAGAVLGVRLRARDPRPLEKALAEAALTVLVPQEELVDNDRESPRREAESERDSFEGPRHGSGS